MSTIIDIMGSTFIAGLLLLLILKLNLFMSNASYASDNELKMQQNAKTYAEILNYDFRKIGYKHDGVSIITAKNDQFKFVGDLQRPGESGYGIIDTVEYFIRDSSYSPGTLNQNDIILVRVVNSKDSISGSSLGLVKLNFSYLDSLSIPTNILSKIKYIKTELWVEPTEPVNNFLTGEKDSVFTYWEFTINPRNI
ncbi:MAG: hypothetical protein OQJ93_04160 [Ignavibacteriaceae bacterium]|nr:hypothetical protein [Ignavibacteriaceae bacterium]MCW8812252.1 hypothetical protein [Chlorobium sp.]MCW9095509.1 hypothetical protein [Ignavibacteriaceae bacterium]MCW9096562.1 hypothetical protein [Ignavibacteriaceae bacterium]